MYVSVWVRVGVWVSVFVGVCAVVVAVGDVTTAMPVVVDAKILVPETCMPHSFEEDTLIEDTLTKEYTLDRVAGVYLA